VRSRWRQLGADRLFTRADWRDVAREFGIDDIDRDEFLRLDGQVLSLEVSGGALQWAVGVVMATAPLTIVRGKNDR
jgi:hypothetical protein